VKFRFRPRATSPAGTNTRHPFYTRHPSNRLVKVVEDTDGDGTRESSDEVLAEKATAKKTGTYDRPVGSGGQRVLTKSTVRPVVSGHMGAHRNLPDATKSALGRKEMVEAVGIEPTSGCL